MQDHLLGLCLARHIPLDELLASHARDVGHLRVARRRSISAWKASVRASISASGRRSQCGSGTKRGSLRWAASSF